MVPVELLWAMERSSRTRRMHAIMRGKSTRSSRSAVVTRGARTWVGKCPRMTRIGRPPALHPMNEDDLYDRKVLAEWRTKDRTGPN